jgi:hypothetical protein
MNTRTTSGRRRRAASPGAGWLAAAATAAALGAAQPAGAATLFTASSTSAGSFGVHEPIGHSFSFGYYDIQISGGCLDCITASAADGSPLGVFGFSTVSGPFNYITNPTGTTQSALPAGGGQYSEHLEGYGTFDITPPYTHPGPVLLGGGSNYFGVTIYATPGSNTATFEFDLDQYATSGALSLPAKPLYLDVTGTTSSPVTLASLTASGPPIYAFAPITIDFNVRLTDTPYSPVAGPPPGVPEPRTWSMMLVGFAAAGAMVRARRRSLALGSRTIA